MDYLTLSVAYTGFKAVSAAVSNFQKLKKLSGLPLEVQEDTLFDSYCRINQTSIRISHLLHARQLTAVHVTSSISLARKVLVECDAFIESISFIKMMMILKAIPMMNMKQMTTMRNIKRH